MRLHGLSALLVAFGWIDECSGFGQSLRWPAFRSPVARATAARMLDIVVEGDKPAAAPVKEEVPEYMKSKRRLYPRKCDVMDQIEYFVQEKISTVSLKLMCQLRNFLWLFFSS